MARQDLSHAHLEKPITGEPWPGLRELVIVATERASEEVRCFELTSRDATALPYARGGAEMSLFVVRCRRETLS
jgi:hypothetical protein